MPRVDWPGVSVVIPMLNAETTIGDQMAALAAQSYPGEWEVVIADNGSTDGGVERILEWADRIESLRVVDASAEPGTVYARNLGVEMAAGPLILMCDADDIVGPGWIRALVEGLRGFDVVRGALEVTTLNDATVNSWYRPLRLSRNRTDLQVEIVPGGNFGITKDAFEALGRWQAHDIEFSARVRAAGLTLNTASDAVVSVRRASDLRTMAAKGFASGTMAWDGVRADPAVGSSPVVIAGMALRWMSWLLLHAPLALVSRATRGRWVRVAATGVGWVSRWFQERRAKWSSRRP